MCTANVHVRLQTKLKSAKLSRERRAEEDARLAAQAEFNTMLKLGNTFSVPLLLSRLRV